MTQGIISLGKAFPLDSLQRAAVSPVGSVGASKCLRPFEVATGDPHLCTLAPGKLSRKTARPAFSVGHFDPLIPLRVESSAGWRHLIFNDLEALQVESSAHFDHLIFTERGGVLQKNRSFQNDNSGGFVTAKIKLRKAELDFRGQPKFPLWGFGSEQLGVTVFWYFPKWEVSLY
ncbi:MAG: hypothetical protein ACLS3Z_00065 [Faecalibacterium sp.]|jgi:hypothetical protein|uniref:Uncharacterized protein n=1 Tax=Faecalibacterium prausnitzii TaxID=853 RepID=A0A6A8KI48_9FIRM|nr:hypothetical protein [Faecalibacterium prausnitzii]MSC46255.1 hypothetical protein [Faecalibacterium prausnitzii]MSC49882.1 hypothetical protein [Faecalibacterium prausnitzii]MSC69410.1 hypothetical protein [Faecalibacterium prausnitzii]MSC75917.1 hypothetical protein [Faecalibacterium prausnitzii]MSC81193.1 hypothetical protein [Faecalibacterium prausnitzii]